MLIELKYLKALEFKSGYGILPAGTYFKTSEFTIMVWIKLYSYN